MELTEQVKDIWVTTESLNRLPIFEPTRMTKYKVRTFEGEFGKLYVEGRLGQTHKNLLETILWKQEMCGFFEDENNKHFRVLYDEYKVKKYLTKGTTRYDHS